MTAMIPILLGLGFFGMIAWIVFVIVDGNRRKERLKVFTDFHSKLIDRMGSSSEFATFLQSDGGRRFLESLSVEKGHPANRIITAVQTGLVLAAVGVGFILAGEWGVQPAAWRGEWEVNGFRIAGVIFTSTGVGFLFSAVASYFLAKSLGVLKPAEATRLD
jgi:hypothetical protein